MSSALCLLIFTAGIITVSSQNTVGQRGTITYSQHCRSDKRCSYMLTLPGCTNGEECNGEEAQPTLTQLLEIVTELRGYMSQLTGKVTELSESVQNIKDRLFIEQGTPRPFDVYCEINESDAWIAIQRRQDGSVNFERNWADYKTGFGNTNGEFWLGNDNLYCLTSQASYKLRIDLEKFDGDTAYAEYATFWIGNESSNYRLHVGPYSGTAGDAIRHHDGRAFSTYDKDNDDYEGDCAADYRGGWWYGLCHDVNLNGIYYQHEERIGNAIIWETWNGDAALKYSTMKIQKLI